MKKIISILWVFIILLTSFVHADTNNTTVKMIMDGKAIDFSTVNLRLDGKPVGTDVPPVIHGNRTLIPIHVIKNMGIDVKWEDSTRKVTIIMEDKTVVMQIDNPTAVTNGEKKKLPSGVPPKIITYKNKGRTMVPIAFLRELGLIIEWDNTTRTVNMNATKRDSASEEIPVKISTIKDINIGFPADIPQIRIKTGEKLDYKVLKLEDPARLVLDFEDTKFDITNKNKLLSNGTLQIDTNSNGIKSLRGAQFQSEPFITRIVVELDVMKNYDIFYDAQVGDMVLQLEKGVIEDIQEDVEEDKTEDKEDIVEDIVIEGLEYREIGKNSSILEITSNTETQYNFSVRDYGKVLQIAVPKEDIELPLDIITINDSLVDNITIGETIDNQQYHIQITLKEDVDYKVSSSPHTQKYIVEFNGRRKNTIPLIVIDPGHGGTAPGATSPINQLVEKNIALDISQRLDKLLTGAGYSTYMTRNSDTTVSLADRAGVANKLQADLFISIHANAVTGNSGPNGIEVLYCPDDSRDNKGVAEIFQREMVKATGARNRGIVERPNTVVLRDTKMPAVLVETGFLTNNEEAEKLATTEYRQTIAEALFQATIKYF